MLLSYRNPNFWKDFRKNHWLPRVPTVIRQPFKEFPISQDTVFRAMKSVEAGLQVGDKRLDVMVSVGDKMTDAARPLRRVFKHDADSLDALEEICGRVFSKKNFGVIVTNCHASHPEVWSAVAAFLQDAREGIDFPVTRAFMDLFYGRYSSSFTALHKDTQDILAFVVRGEKRMLAWPFEYFLGKVEGISPGDKFFNKRLDHVDHRKFRKDAVVLDAKAGDLIYWPGDHWHVSEPKTKAFSGMMSLGILRPELVPSETKPSPFQKKLLRTNSGPGLLSQDMTDVIPASDAERAFRWATGFGFEIGGPMAEPRRGADRKPLSVKKSRSAIILWHRDSALKQLVVSSGGHVLTLPNSSELAAVLEQLSKGESVLISPDSKRASNSKIQESYWTKQGKSKIRKVSGRDPMLWLVHWLSRVGAAEA